MKVVRLLSLVALSAATFWVTSSLIARDKVKRGALARTTGIVRPAEEAIHINPQGASVHPHSMAEITLVSMDAIVHGRQVIISQTAHVVERVGGTLYMWHLQVSGDRSFDRFYRQQVFPPVPGGLQPEFHDMVDLPPGDYQVRVILHRVPPGFHGDLRELRGGVSGFKMITVE